MIQLTAEQIKEKLESKETFILDFYADWCGPCKMLMKNIEMAENAIKEGNIKLAPIYKYDVESDRDFTTQMGIRGVPTLKLFKEGVEIKSTTGLIAPAQFIQLNEEVI